MMHAIDITTFEKARPGLLGLAYRILGSRADAEDAVQDSFVKWSDAERTAIDNPPAWLTSVCTRRCLDMLRSAQRARVDYVGAWLPEPIHTPTATDAEGRLELADSLTMAFLLVLERLTPKERAAYLLHDIFDLPYAEIAATLEMRESACRKLVSRAKANVEQARPRPRPGNTTPVERQDDLLNAFHAAITSGATAPLAALLADDVRLQADGGGKVRAIRRPLKGRDEVMTFVTDGLAAFWADYDWAATLINGLRGFILRDGQTVVAAVSFDFNARGQAREVYIVRNPDKLAGLGPISIH